MSAMNPFPRSKHMHIHNNLGYLRIFLYLSGDLENPFFVILISTLFLIRQDYFSSVNAGNEVGQEMLVYV